jgi:protein TonB
MPPGAEKGDSDKSASSGRNESTDPTTNQTASIVEHAGIYEVPPEVAEGSLLHRVEPDYPEEARSRQIQGPVVLQVRAGSDGSVQQVNVVSGQPLLANAAVAAVKQWRFRPHMVQGKPEAMQMKVTLNFKLPTAGSAPQ